MDRAADTSRRLASRLAGALPLAGVQQAMTTVRLEPLGPARFGQWLGPADFPGGQDLFAARRPAPASP